MSAAASPLALRDKLQAHFRQRFGDPEQATVARAPGRVNLLGEHTDYNDGLVLPMTVDRSVWLALRRRDDRNVRLYSLEYDEGVGYVLDAPPDYNPGEVGWANYVGGVIEELRRLELLDSGFEGVVAGDVPRGAGLSSSAALSVATAVTLQQLFGFALEPVEMIKLCQRVEHRYAGVQCGIMDPFAARLGRAGHALFLDCRSLAHRPVTLPLTRACVVIVHSGVDRALAGSAYNQRRDECRQALAELRRQRPTLSSLRDVDAALLDAHARQMSDVPARRARHVVEENRRVEDAVAALAGDGGTHPAGADVERFGELMNASHDSLRDLFQVSCPQLDALVEIARGCDGVYGARMTGAGFGGCTVNWVHPDAVDGLIGRISVDYRERFGVRPGLYVLHDNAEAGPVG